MMTLLSGALTWLVGKGASTLTIPALLFGTVFLWHQYTKEGDARVAAQATNVCDESWKTATRQQERDAARQETLIAQEVLQGERKVNDNLRKDLEFINAQYELLRVTYSNDPRCLSDSVLRSLDGAGQDEHPTGLLKGSGRRAGSKRGDTP
jgi:hypothetical protein